MMLIEKARMRMEKKMERKLVSQAAKNFNIHLHARNLKKENQMYLDKLNSQITNKLKLYTSPVKRAKFSSNPKFKKSQLDTSDSFESSLSSQTEADVRYCY